MKQGAKSFACKCQVDNALDRADKNREKKLKTFDLSYLLNGRYFDKAGSQNYLVFKPFFNSFITTPGRDIILR